MFMNRKQFNLATFVVLNESVKKFSTCFYESLNSDKLHIHTLMESLPYNRNFTYITVFNIRHCTNYVVRKIRL